LKQSKPANARSLDEKNKKWVLHETETFVQYPFILI